MLGRQSRSCREVKYGSVPVSTSSDPRLFHYRNPVSSSAVPVMMISLWRLGVDGLLILRTWLSIIDKYGYVLLIYVVVLKSMYSVDMGLQ